MSAFVFVQVREIEGWDQMRSLHDAIHRVAGVKTVHSIAGPTDIVVFVNAADQSALGATLGKIRALKGVVSTDTRIVWPM